MTYHADLAPRRRSWLIATPLVLVVVLGFAWSTFWYYAAGQAETRINEWQAQQVGAGRVFSCGKQAVGGFLKGKKLSLGDGVNGDDASLLDTFPYASDPKAGFDNTKGLQKP